jgi:hypothetical protein
MKICLAIQFFLKIQDAFKMHLFMTNLKIKQTLIVFLKNSIIFQAKKKESR